MEESIVPPEVAMGEFAKYVPRSIKGENHPLRQIKLKLNKENLGYILYNHNTPSTIE